MRVAHSILLGNGDLSAAFGRDLIFDDLGSGMSRSGHGHFGFVFVASFARAENQRRGEADAK